MCFIFLHVKPLINWCDLQRTDLIFLWGAQATVHSAPFGERKAWSKREGSQSLSALRWAALQLDHQSSLYSSCHCATWARIPICTCKVPIIWWCHQRFGWCCWGLKSVRVALKANIELFILQARLVMTHTEVSMLALFQSLSADQVPIWVSKYV